MWPRLKNSPHTYAHEGLESIFLFEFIELQWVQTDFLRLSDNNILVTIHFLWQICRHSPPCRLRCSAPSFAMLRLWSPSYMLTATGRHFTRLRVVPACRSCRFVCRHERFGAMPAYMCHIISWLKFSSLKISLRLSSLLRPWSPVLSSRAVLSPLSRFPS